MKAQFVNENIRFERGKDPKTAMGIGDWSIKRALIDQSIVHQPGSLEYDASKEWWSEGGIPEEFQKEIGYSGDPNDIIGFDEEWYMENVLPEEIDADEFLYDFTPKGRKQSKPNSNNWGTFQWQRGTLPDGTIVYHYSDGLGSGFLTRREWLK